VGEEIDCGYFRPEGELIVGGVEALREGSAPNSLAAFLRDSSLVGPELRFERAKDTRLDTTFDRISSRHELRMSR
jgi:hypothetical protein